MLKKILFSIICIIATNSALSYEDNTEFQISIVPDLAVHSRQTEIEGFSLNLLWGENPQENCLALGFINGSTGYSNGFSLGLINYTESYKGLQLGLYNTASQSLSGTQVGLINQAKSLTGLQLGIMNSVDGIQQGVQIGLINVNSHEPHSEDDSSAILMPIINWNF